MIWHEHFTPIIGKEQVEYMLSRFQSYPALQDQVLTGYEYYRLLGNRKLCGYMAIRQDQDGRMFLSKLYIAKQYRGRHLAAFLFDFLKNLRTARSSPDFAAREYLPGDNPFLPVIGSPARNRCPIGVSASFFASRGAD